MRNRFDENGKPDIQRVVAEYRDAVKKRLRWVGPILGGALLLLIVLVGTYSVEPGEVGVVRTFGRASLDQSQPGLHFAWPIAQKVNIVDTAKIRRVEVGFRSTDKGPKRVDNEALMLTGDENIIEAQMIVQYQIADPVKYLFKLSDPDTVLLIAAEVALRGAVGTMRITSSIEELGGTETPSDLAEEIAALEQRGAGAEEDAAAGEGGGAPQPGEDAEKKPDEDAAKKDAAEKPKDPPKRDPAARGMDQVKMDPSTDILTTGRERAQTATREQLQQLMDLYESGLKITEVKLQVVDAPDEVKDAFHDVVRAREEREQKINKALGYREDRIPKARGEAQKVMRAAEAYKRERVLRAQGEAARFVSILREYDKARAVTRQRLHLETLERILAQVEKKVFIDQDVARNALPFLPLGGGGKLPVPEGGAP